MGFQLIAGLVMAGLLTAGFLSWKADIRAEGEAKLRTEYEAQQLAAAQENERIAAEGKAAVLRLLAEKERQNRVQAAQLANLQAQRQGESDARARDDVNYALWRETAVPRSVSDRLRVATQSVTDATGNSRVPARADVSTDPAIPAITGTAHESWLGSIYRRIVGSTQVGVDRGRPGSK